MSRSSHRDLSQKIADANRRSQGAGYTLRKQRPQTTVALAVNPLGPDYGQVLIGRILDHTGRMVTVQWADGEPEVWSGDDLQYKLDRGLLVLTPPPKPRRTRIPKDKLKCKECGELRKDCDCPRKGAVKPEEWTQRNFHPDVPEQSADPALTKKLGDGNIMASPRGQTPQPEEKEKDMATDEKLSAKEVAIELGTDARTLRKFFRSGASPVDPVGQGGRYGIDRKQLKKVRKAFDAWAAGKKPAAKKKEDLPEDLPEELVEEVTIEDEVEDEDPDEEPTDEDIEFLELDLDEDFDLELED